MTKKKFKSKLQSFLRFLIGPTLIYWVTWAFARAKGGLVLFSSLFVIVGYLYISSPNRLVIDKYNNVEGIVNQLRLYAQGRRFLYNQLVRAEAIVNSNSYSGKSVAHLMEEVENQWEILDRSVSIIDELNRADILRREADRIERREIYEYLETLRQRRIEDCKIIIPQIKARLLITGPTYTHWILLGCFVLALTFIAVLLAPNSFKHLLKEGITEDMDSGCDPDAWLTEDPRSGSIVRHLHRSQAKIHKGNYLDAIEDLNYSIEKYPDCCHLYHYRGLAKQLSENFTEALSDYNKAIEMDDFHDIETYYFRASINFNLHNYNDSIKDLNRVIESSPKHYSAYYLRGLTKMHLDDREGAIRDLQEASSLEFEPAKEILKQIHKC